MFVSPSTRLREPGNISASAHEPMFIDRQKPGNYTKEGV